MRRLLFLPLLALLSACQAESEYSSWNCRFSYDNSLYLDETLASAMTADSRGVFCKISETTQAGTKYLVFTNNQQLTTRKKETVLETQARYILGLNNGIIVGYQTFVDQPYGGFTAYDAQCPNCVRRENNLLNPKYPLTMSGSGIASCAKCGLKYDMNNGGVVQNGKEGDTGLEKYLAMTTGPLGYVTVARKQ